MSTLVTVPVSGPEICVSSASPWAIVAKGRCECVVPVQWREPSTVTLPTEIRPPMFMKLDPNGVSVHVLSAAIRTAVDRLVSWPASPLAALTPVKVR